MCHSLKYADNTCYNTAYKCWLTKHNALHNKTIKNEDSNNVV